MSAVRVTGAADPTLDWGEDVPGMAAYARSLAALAPDGLLGNGRVALHALQLRDRAFLVVEPRGPQHGWLTSLAVTYGRSAREEAARGQGGSTAAMFGAASWLVEGLLRLTRSDAVVFVNHPLLSTSLYGGWTGADLDPALAALRQAFPGRAIVWRSLNTHDNPGLLAAMAGRGARPLLSRIVWTLSDPARQWAPRTDVKADRRLAAGRGLAVTAPRRLSARALARIQALYAGVYLDKYSRTNPDYTPGFLRAATDSGVLAVRLVQDGAGVIQAFAADHVNGDTLASPLLGHDRAQPVEAGLYRVAMSLSVEQALERGLKVNYSAGASTFKRNRGARPALEYMMVFDRHLPVWRRLGYGWLSRALTALTPALERIALR